MGQPIKNNKPSQPTRAEIDAVKAASKRAYDRFMALTDAEKTREADAAARAKSRPLTAAERAMFDEMGIGRRRGRPRNGRGARQISVTVERGLLYRVDQFARQRGLSRAQLIAQSLERAMAG
jgi:hypothetical protein